MPADNYEHWHQPWQSSDNADQTSEYQEFPHESVMDDKTSNTANVGTLSVPSQTHQFVNLQVSCTTFSAMTEKPMQRSLRRLKRTNPTWPQILVKSSRLKTWPTLPATWQLRHRLCRSMLCKWRPCQTLRIDIMTED